MKSIYWKSTVDQIDCSLLKNVCHYVSLFFFVQILNDKKKKETSDL